MGNIFYKMAIVVGVTFVISTSYFYFFHSQLSSAQVSTSDVQVADSKGAHLKTDISFKKAYQWHQNQEALFLDGRSMEEFYEGHISGAISAHHVTVHRNSIVLALDRNARIVTYCNNEKCPISHMLRDKLVAMGFQHVFVYVGGIADWRQQGHSLSRSMLYSQ